MKIAIITAAAVALFAITAGVVLALTPTRSDYTAAKNDGAMIKKDLDYRLLEVQQDLKYIGRLDPALAESIQQQAEALRQTISYTARFTYCEWINNVATPDRRYYPSRPPHGDFKACAVEFP